MPITYVLVSRSPFSDFLFEHMREIDDVRIIEHPLPHRARFSRWLRAIDVYLLPWSKFSLHFDRAYVEQLRSIRPEDCVLYFSIENRKDLQIARKFIDARRQFVWLWNPIRSSRGNALSRLWYLFWLRRSGIQPCTFEPSDARDFGMRLANQVYRHVAVPSAVSKDSKGWRSDVYFLGMDKGRLAELRFLKAELERLGLKPNFHVLPDRRRRYSDEDRACLSNDWVSYSDNLRNVWNSRAVLELMQGGQRGPTIRTMEAVFMNRKLITNNSALRQTVLYHPSRIFVLGQDDMAQISRFINSPLEPVHPSVLRDYDIEHWIRQFGAGTDR